MEGASVAGDGNGNPAGDGDKLAERAVEGRGCTGGCLRDGLGEGLFAGPDIDHNAEALSDEVSGYGCVTLGGPALCAPTGSRIDEDDGVAGGQVLGGPGFGGGINWKQGRKGRQIVSGNGGGQLKILLDDVNTARGDFLGIEKTGGNSRGRDSPMMRRQPVMRAIQAERIAP